jgi:transcriptional regulator with XRE-family HTH domain
MRASKLAANTGVSKGYVSGLLSGNKVQPSIETCKKFSEVLDCSLAWLFQGELSPPSASSSAPSAPPRFDSSNRESELLGFLEDLLETHRRIAIALEKLVEIEEERDSLKQSDIK